MSDSLSNLSWYDYTALSAIGISLVAFIVSFSFLISFLGSSDRYKEIQTQVYKVLIPVLIGVVLLLVGSIMYAVSSPSIMYILTIVSFLSLGFSYSAIAISVISKS